MGRIRTNITIRDKNYWTLFDSGARNTYVTREVAKQFPIFDLPIANPVALGGKTQTANKFCNLICKIDQYSIVTHARVLDDIGKDEEGQNIEVLFGALAMQEWGIKLDVPGEKLDMTHYSKEFVEF